MEVPSPPVAASDSDVPWTTSESWSARDLARRVASLPRRLWGRRALVATLVRRDLATRTQGTLLGRLWPLVTPLATFAAYFFVFTRVLGLRAERLGASDGALAAYMFVGALMWSAIAESLARSAHSIGEHAELVKKVPLAAEVLPLQRCLVAHVLALAGAAAFVAVRVATTRELQPLAQLAWLAPTLVVQLALCFGLGLAAAAAQVLVRDTVHVLQLVLSLTMLATPLFWVADARALPGIEPYLPWIELNPIHHLACAWRTALGCELAGEPLARSLAYSGAWAALALALGAFVFVLAERRFADEV